MGRICYFHAFSGMSGDMTVGALVDAGADPIVITQTLESLGLMVNPVTREVLPMRLYLACAPR